MMKLSSLALGAFALTIAIPSHAQTAEDLACVKDSAPDWLAEAMVDDYLFSTGGIGEGTERPFRETVGELSFECAQQLGIPEAEVLAYIQYSMTLLMAPEIRTLLIEEGADVERLDQTMSYHLNDESLGLEEFLALIVSDAGTIFQAGDSPEYVGRLLAAYALSAHFQRDFLTTFGE